MENIFETVISEYAISSLQKNQYLRYINFLLVENEKYNLTNIKTKEQIVYYHIIDTLMITKVKLLDSKNSIADIGTGCGVPGILLAIFYPKKKFILIEVVQKKINFLNQVITLLGLENCTVSPYDFLTFMRQKNFKVDVFVARASLSLKEIIKVYQIAFYKNTEIIYWGSRKWQDDSKHNVVLNNKSLLVTEFLYEIKENKNIRRLNYIKIKKII